MPDRHDLLTIGCGIILALIGYTVRTMDKRIDAQGTEIAVLRQAVDGQAQTQAAANATGAAQYHEIERQLDQILIDIGRLRASHADLTYGDCLNHAQSAEERRRCANFASHP